MISQFYAFWRSPNSAFDTVGKHKPMTAFRSKPNYLNVPEADFSNVHFTHIAFISNVPFADIRHYFSNRFKLLQSRQRRHSSFEFCGYFDPKLSCWVTANDLNRTIALLTGFYFYSKKTFKSLSPGHRLVLLCPCFFCPVGNACLALFRLAGVIVTWSPLFGANTPWKRVRLTLVLNTSAAKRAIKPKGSEITWVVPSR